MLRNRQQHNHHNNALMRHTIETRNLKKKIVSLFDFEFFLHDVRNRISTIRCFKAKTSSQLEKLEISLYTMVENVQKTKIQDSCVDFFVSARDDRDLERKRVEERKSGAGSRGAVHKSGF